MKLVQTKFWNKNSCLNKNNYQKNSHFQTTIIHKNISKRHGTFYVNGKYVNEKEATVSVKDLGLLRGFGVFDFLRTFNGKLFLLDKNIERLQNSCRFINLTLPHTPSDLTNIIQTTLDHNLEENNKQEYGIRIVVTGGVSPDNITPTGNSSLFILAQPITNPSLDLVEKGGKIISFSESRLFPAAKTTMYTPAVIGYQKAYQQGAIEAFYLDKQRNILECTTANIFAVKENVLITPPCNGEILSGITRLNVIQMAKENGISVVEKNIHYDDFVKSDEVFITSASKLVMPITTVDQFSIGNSQVGPITKRIHSLFFHFRSN